MYDFSYPFNCAFTPGKIIKTNTGSLTGRDLRYRIQKPAWNAHVFRSIARCILEGSLAEKIMKQESEETHHPPKNKRSPSWRLFHNYFCVEKISGVYQE